MTMAYIRIDSRTKLEMAARFLLQFCPEVVLPLALRNWKIFYGFL